MFRKIIVILLCSAIMAMIGYFVYMQSIAHKVIANFFVAANTQSCNTLNPSLNKDVICPRGDVGNFMVIDEVNYTIEHILGSQLSKSKQVLVKVCVEARGLAAWNEGDYSSCSNDPRIIEFQISGLAWKVRESDLTNISNLIRQSGKKPEGYDNYRDDCIKSHIASVTSGGRGYDCNNVVRDDVEYSIKTHQFVEPGRAH